MVVCASFGANLVCVNVGVLFMTKISSSLSDQFVYQSPPLQVAKENVFYVGLWDFLDANVIINSHSTCHHVGLYTSYTLCPFL